MKIIWSIVGILVLLMIIYFISKNVQVKPDVTMQAEGNKTLPEAAPTTNTIIQEKVIHDVVIQPVYIGRYFNCNNPTYIARVDELYNIFLTKRDQYQAELNNPMSHAIELHREMTIAYNNWYNEKAKCRII